MSFHIDTAIPYGNACDTDVVDGGGGAAEVFFTPDPRGGPEALWFCFRIVRRGLVGVGEKLRIVLRYPDTLLGGTSPETMRPAAAVDGGNWFRLDAPVAETTPDGLEQWVWETEAPQRELMIATCYPYGPADVEFLLAETSGYYQSTSIGVSQKARPITRIFNRAGSPEEDTRPGLYLTARTHAGETPGSWVLDGLLRRFAELGDAAPLVWCVPFVDPDGVLDGNYGKDAFPYDLNRGWTTPPMRHEVLCIQRDLLRWSRRCAPWAVLDFHAPALCDADGIFAFLPGAKVPVQSQEASEELAQLLEQKLPKHLIHPTFGHLANTPSRWDTPRATTYAAEHYTPRALCIETPYALAGNTLFQPSDYRQAGACMADAICGAVTDA